MADTVATMRTAIYAVLTRLDADSNIGLIHDYERWALQWEKVLEVLRDPTDGVVRSWMVIYGGEAPEIASSFYSQVPGTNKALVIRAHRWMIRGVLAVDDAAESEKTFANLTERVQNALDGDSTLHDQDQFYGDPPMAPCELVTFEIRSFSGVLCHVAEITFTLVGTHVAAQV